MRAALRTIVLALAVALLALGVAPTGSGPGAAQASDPGGPHYPDIQTLEPSQVRFSQTDDSLFLKLTNSIANLGDGPFELFPVNNEQEETTDAYQRVYTHDADGKWTVFSEEKVGTFAFHPTHNHWHFEGFAMYELRSKTKDGGVGDEVLASTDKVSFCMLDGDVYDDTLEHYLGFRYAFCSQDDAQGISVGYSDVYTYFLPGQSIDVTGVPAGEYWLVSTADPDNYIVETDEKNNSAAVLVTIDEKKLKGSADCDGDVDTVDSLHVLRSVAGLPTDAKCLEEADADCDNVLEALDAQFILRFVADLPVQLPVGCPPIGTLA